MITQRELADLAGLTQASISLALRGSARIAPETRSRVAELARKHGYRADPAIEALAHRRWGKKRPLAIAYLASRSVFGRDRYADGVAARCSELGVRLWTIPRRDDVAESLARRRIAGVVVGQTTLADCTSVFLPPGLRAVHCGLVAPPGPGDMACADLSAAGPATCAALAELGFRRIAAAVIADPGSLSDQFLAGGLLAYARTARSERLAVWVGGSGERKIAPSWLMAQRAEALIVYDVAIADALRKAGERRPIASLIALEERQDVAGTILPFELIGERAVDLLLERLRDRQPAPGTRRIELVTMPWRDGVSLSSGK